MVNPTYFDDINTRVQAVLSVADLKVSALDSVVAILKAKGVATQKLEQQCGQIHSQMETLEAVLEVDN